VDHALALDLHDDCGRSAQRLQQGPEARLGGTRGVGRKPLREESLFEAIELAQRAPREVSCMGGAERRPGRVRCT